MTEFLVLDNVAVWSYDINLFICCICCFVPYVLSCSSCSVAISTLVDKCKAAATVPLFQLAALCNRFATPARLVGIVLVWPNRDSACKSNIPFSHIGLGRLIWFASIFPLQKMYTLRCIRAQSIVFCDDPHNSLRTLDHKLTRFRSSM